MITPRQLAYIISSKHPAIVLRVFARKKLATIIDLKTMKVRIVSITDLEPYNPDYPNGIVVGGGRPQPVELTDEDIAALIDLGNDTGSLDGDKIRYKSRAQVVAHMKIKSLQKIIIQSEDQESEDKAFLQIYC